MSFFFLIPKMKQQKHLFIPLLESMGWSQTGLRTKWRLKAEHVSLCLMTCHLKIYTV